MLCRPRSHPPSEGVGDRPLAAYDRRTPALAALLACTVIGIADGDSLTARCSLPDSSYSNIQVRRADIDVREQGQAWRQRSKQHLAEMCLPPCIVMLLWRSPVAVCKLAETPDGVHNNRRRPPGRVGRSASLTILSLPSLHALGLKSRCLRGHAPSFQELIQWFRTQLLATT